MSTRNHRVRADADCTASSGLRFGDSLELGGWSLKLSLCSLRRRQFASRENDNPDQGDGPAKQQHDLAGSQAKLAPGDAPPCAKRVDGGEFARQIDYAQHSAEDRNGG